MSSEDEQLAELLRSAAADAERMAPAFDADRIVATAHRRRPWLAVAGWLRGARLGPRPVLAIAALVLVVALAGVLVATLTSGGGAKTAVGTTTTGPPPVSTTVAPPTSTSGPPVSTTIPPTSVPPTTTVASYTYSVVWDNHRVSIFPVRVVELSPADAILAGTATGFETNDPHFAPLEGMSIDVWVAPQLYPNDYVVDNGRQPQTPKGTWVFPR